MEASDLFTFLCLIGIVFLLCFFIDANTSDKKKEREDLILKKHNRKMELLDKEIELAKQNKKL